MTETLMGFKVIERDNGNLAAISMCPSGDKLIEVAWDMCAGCNQHLNNCAHDIPVEPDYIKCWRLGIERATSVYSPKTSDQSPKSFGRPVSTQKSNPLNVLDLVDDEMVAKIKAGKEAR